MVRYALLAIGLAASLEGAASAQTDDPARMSAQACANAPFELTAEQRTLLCAALTGPLDPPLRLARIDEALQRIGGPSPVNAMLSGARIQALLGLGRRADGLRAARQAMQRYPRLPPLWAQATIVFAFTEYTAEAADFWIELTRFSPEMARSIRGYYWRNIRERLAAQGKADKVGELARALDAIGYDGGDEASRSVLAEDLFDEAVARAGWDRARALLPRISSPDKLARIAVDERTRPLWDEVAWRDAAGRAAAVRRWITGLGAAARADGELGGRFISAATAHLGPAPVLAAYEPELRAAMRAGAARTDHFGLTFWLAPLATAYVVAGDDAGAEALYREALAFFATLDNPVRLNVSANLAQFLQIRGRNEEALALIDSSIAELQRMGGVDGALLQMYGVRARTLAALGREPEAWRSLELLRQSRASVPEVSLHTLLGLGRYEEARDLLVEQLRRPSNYTGAVLFLQHPTAAFRVPVEAVPEDLLARLRADPAVLAALEGKGRILDVEPIRLESLELPPLTPDPPTPLR